MNEQKRRYLSLIIGWPRMLGHHDEWYYTDAGEFESQMEHLGSMQDADINFDFDRSMSHVVNGLQQRKSDVISDMIDKFMSEECDEENS